MVRNIRLVIKYKKCPRNRSPPLVLVIEYDYRLTYRNFLDYVAMKTEVEVENLRIKRNYWKVISSVHEANVHDRLAQRRAHVYYFEWVFLYL